MNAKAKVEPLITPLPMQAASQDIWHTKYQLCWRRRTQTSNLDYKLHRIRYRV